MACPICGMDFGIFHFYITLKETSPGTDTLSN